MSIIKIPIAKYKDNGAEEEIRAREITTRELYREKFRGKLYCKEIGCNARLHHVDLRNTGGSVFFRTNRGNNPHKENCPSEVVYNGTTTYTTGNGEAIEVTDKHIKGTIERRKKLHKDKLKGVQKTSGVVNNASNRKTEVPPKPTKGKGAVTPSLNGQGKIANDDEKGTRISGKEANQITEKDFGKPRCIDGYIKEVNLYENYAQIQFKESGEYEVFIEFGEAFKDNNSTAFNLLNFIEKYVDFIKNKNEDIYCVCVGLVQKRVDKVVVEVYKELEFVIEDSTITEFAILNNDLLSEI